MKDCGVWIHGWGRARVGVAPTRRWVLEGWALRTRKEPSRK